MTRAVDQFDITRWHIVDGFLFLIDEIFSTIISVRMCAIRRNQNRQ